MQYIFSHAFAIIFPKSMWASDLTNKYLSDLAEQHKTSSFHLTVGCFCPVGRNNLLLDGGMVENKGKLILTDIFPSVQKHGI